MQIVLVQDYDFYRCRKRKQEIPIIARRWGFFLDRDFEVFGSISVSVYFIHEQIKGNMLALSELQILISKT